MDDIHHQDKGSLSSDIHLNLNSCGTVDTTPNKWVVGIRQRLGLDRSSSAFVRYYCCIEVYTSDICAPPC